MSRPTDIPKVVSHKKESKLKPIITNKMPPLRQRMLTGNQTATSKGKFIKFPKL